MTRKLIGYEENLLEVDGEFDYTARSYSFSPIYENAPGMIATASMRMCRECRSVVSSMGGPGYRCVCLKCYPAVKLADFAQGHTHDIKEY